MWVKTPLSDRYILIRSVSGVVEWNLHESEVTVSTTLSEQISFNSKTVDCGC